MEHPAAVTSAIGPILMPAPPKVPTKKAAKPKAKAAKKAVAKPKAKKAAKPKAKAAKKAAKVVKTKRKPGKVKVRPAVVARTERPAVVARTERLDLRLTKAEKAKLNARAKASRRTITSLVIELIEKMK